MTIVRSLPALFVALVLAIITLSVSPKDASSGFDNVTKSREHFGKAQAAYTEKDWATFLSETLATAELRPGHPTLVYNLACAYALNDSVDHALHWLEVYADMGLNADASADQDLASIQEDPRFQNILQKLEANTQPITHSEVAFILDAPDLIPEGITYDPKTQAFFVSGIHGKRVLRRSADGAVTEFATRETAAIQSAFGMAADAENRLLYIGSAAVDQTPGVDSAAVGFSQLNQVDLDTGQLKKQFITSPMTKPHVLNDVCIAESGVYTTDNQSGEVYRIAPGTDAMDLWIPRGRFHSPQGITPSAKGDWLFVADYSTGIHRIDATTKESIQLDPGERNTMLGIDGLAYHDGSLIAIQNGVAPHRVIRIDLDDTETAITGVEVLEQRNPVFDEPTLGTIVGDDFYYIANSQWGQLQIGGAFRDESKLAKPTILRISLK